jgi:hypothetical protein
MLLGGEESDVWEQTQYVRFLCSCNIRTLRGFPTAPNDLSWLFLLVYIIPSEQIMVLILWIDGGEL